MQPEDMDFLSNFSTFGAIVLGAVLATLSGFVSTQVEQQIERRRRERDAALFFGELLSTVTLILEFAKAAHGRGDPFGPITLRLLRGVSREIDIYDRNREHLFDLHDHGLRARLHSAVLRITMTIEGVLDGSEEIRKLDGEAKSGALNPNRLANAEKTLVEMRERRDAGFGFALETGEELKGLVKSLEPVARFNFDQINKIVPRSI